jgi:hypothetical protein
MKINININKKNIKNKENIHKKVNKIDFINYFFNFMLL